MSIPRLTKETVTTSGSTITRKLEGSFPLHPISCTVTEERNGEYELEMEIPYTDKYFSEIKIGRIIRAPHNSTGDLESFEIYSIENTLDGIAHISAWHITYRTRGMLLEPFTLLNATASTVFESFGSHILGPALAEYFFTFYASATDPVNVFEVKEPTTVREVIKTVMETFGGEIQWDTGQIQLLSSRGKDSGVVLQYGRNITALKREQTGEDIFTGIYPYWIGEGSDGTEKKVTLPEEVVTSSYLDDYYGTYEIIIPLDFSDRITSEPTAASLRTVASDWMNVNAPRIISENIDASVLQMDEDGKTAVAKLNLCDTLRISYPDMGINVKAKVTKTVFNVLLDRYESVSIGTATNMNTAIKKVVGIK